MDPCIMADHKPNIHVGIITAVKKPEDVLIPGKVDKVCRQWLIHEDGALAYKLQNEEIQSHYGGNKERNAIVRQDIPKAKEEQEKEMLEARKLQEAQFYRLKQQEKQDADLALKLQEELMIHERKKLETLQTADHELAKKLQVEENIEINIAGAQSPTSHNIPHDDLYDLSDFCIQPPPGMDQESIKKLREDQDAELALLLQEQETKRRGDLLNQDQLLALEAQDRELAKMLYEQEKMKMKRAKERAKQKAMLKKQQKAMDGTLSYSGDEVASCSSSSDTSTLSDYSKEKIHFNTRNSSINVDNSTQSPVKYSNVAMAIDPTYRRKHKEDKSSDVVIQEGEPVLLRDILDDSPIPPYMPIQGQRRFSPIDEKKRKKRESREGCKQQ